MRRVALLLVGFLFGCVPPDPTGGGGCGVVLVDPLAAIPVAEAHLEEVELWQAGLLAGRTEGQALLVVTDTDGATLTFDVRLEGSHAGLVMDASINAPFDSTFPLTLPANPVSPVSVRQLLGNYEGTHVGVDVIAGFHWRELKNPAEVRLNVASLSFGFGFVPMTWEIVGMQLFDDPADFVDDPCAFGGCDVCSDGDGVCDPGCNDADCDCVDEGTCDEEDQLRDPCDWFAPGGRGSCGNGLVCVRRADTDDRGVCRRDCGAGADACLGFGGTCQDTTTLPRGVFEAAVCLERAGADAPCHALLDPDACDDGLECRPAGAFEQPDGTVAFDDLRCKETCGPDSTGLDACADPLEQCVAVALGAPSCGTAVPPMPASRLDAFPEGLRCNEHEGRRYCDQSAFEGALEPGLTVCVPFSTPSSSATDDGFCFALCASPTIDRDGDGDIATEEKGATLECGAGFTCTSALAQAAGLYDGPPAFPGGTQPRACDPAACPEGAPCAACGPGDATCSTALGAPLCLAPLGSCEAL